MPSVPLILMFSDPPLDYYGTLALTAGTRLLHAKKIPNDCDELGDDRQDMCPPMIREQ